MPRLDSTNLTRMLPPPITQPHHTDSLRLRGLMTVYKMTSVWRHVHGFIDLCVRSGSRRMWGFLKTFDEVFSFGTLHYMFYTTPYEWEWWHYWVLYRLCLSFNTVLSLSSPYVHRCLWTHQIRTPHTRHAGWSLSRLRPSKIYVTSQDQHDFQMIFSPLSHHHER